MDELNEDLDISDTEKLLVRFCKEAGIESNNAIIDSVLVKALNTAFGTWLGIVVTSPLGGAPIIPAVASLIASAANNTLPYEKVSDKVRDQKTLQIIQEACSVVYTESIK